MKSSIPHTRSGNGEDTTKARKRLGWSAETSLADGLDLTVAWLLSH